MIRWTSNLAPTSADLGFPCIAHVARELREAIWAIGSNRHDLWIGGCLGGLQSADENEVRATSGADKLRR